jgi:hypothetical protein
MISERVAIDWHGIHLWVGPEPRSGVELSGRPGPDWKNTEEGNFRFQLDNDGGGAGAH